MLGGGIRSGVKGNSHCPVHPHKQGHERVKTEHSHQACQGEENSKFRGGLHLGQHYRGMRARDTG